MPDLLEDFIAFAYATQSDNTNVCQVCGAGLEENDNGDLCCLECGD